MNPTIEPVTLAELEYGDRFGYRSFWTAALGMFPTFIGLHPSDTSMAIVVNGEGLTSTHHFDHGGLVRLIQPETPCIHCGASIYLPDTSPNTWHHVTGGTACTVTTYATPAETGENNAH